MYVELCFLWTKKRIVHWPTFLFDRRWDDVHRKGLGKIQNQQHMKCVKL